MIRFFNYCKDKCAPNLKNTWEYLENKKFNNVEYSRIIFTKFLKHVSIELVPCNIIKASRIKWSYQPKYCHLDF